MILDPIRYLGLTLSTVLVMASHQFPRMTNMNALRNNNTNHLRPRLKYYIVICHQTFPSYSYHYLACSSSPPLNLQALISLRYYRRCQRREAKYFSFFGFRSSSSPCWHRWRRAVPSPANSAQQVKGLSTSLL